MSKFIFIFLIYIAPVYTFAQIEKVDSDTFKSIPCACKDIVYSVYGFFIDGDSMCNLLLENNMRANTYYCQGINNSVKRQYPYFDFSKYQVIHHLKFSPLIIFNNAALSDEEEKSTLSKYYDQKIITLHFIKRPESIKKYGFIKGRRGALIIRTE